MSSFKIFDIVGSGLSAQSVRLNTVASNLANADSVSGDPNTVYRARHPVFQAVQAAAGANASPMDRASGATVEQSTVSGGLGSPLPQPAVASAPTNRVQRVMTRITWAGSGTRKRGSDR